MNGSAKPDCFNIPTLTFGGRVRIGTHGPLGPLEPEPSHQSGHDSSSVSFVLWPPSPRSAFVPLLFHILLLFG